jgi:hypothetical protein
VSIEDYDLRPGKKCRAAVKLEDVCFVSQKSYQTRADIDNPGAFCYQELRFFQPFAAKGWGLPWQTAHQARKLNLI